MKKYAILLLSLALSAAAQSQEEIRDPGQVGSHANQLEDEAVALSNRLVTQADSARYASMLTQLYDSDPYNEKYFAWILQFYDSPRQRHRLETFVDERLQKEPDSTMPWILKGEIAMRAQRWDEAVEAYLSADKIDPNSLPVVFNIGISMTQLAMELRTEKLNTKKTLTKRDIDDIRTSFTDAKTYLEKARAMDPHRKKVDWVTALYMVYYTLGEKEKADELEPLVHGFKQVY